MKEKVFLFIIVPFASSLLGVTAFWCLPSFNEGAMYCMTGLGTVLGSMYIIKRMANDYSKVYLSGFLVLLVSTIGMILITKGNSFSPIYRLLMFPLLPYLPAVAMSEYIGTLVYLSFTVEAAWYVIYLLSRGREKGIKVTTAEIGMAGLYLFSILLQITMSKTIM